MDIKGQVQWKEMPPSRVPTEMLGQVALTVISLAWGMSPFQKQSHGPQGDVIHPYRDRAPELRGLRWVSKGNFQKKALGMLKREDKSIEHPLQGFLII